MLRRLRGGDTGSGTLGSAAALLLALALRPAGWVVQLVVALAVLVASVWSTDRFTHDQGDPGWVVIDEAAGTLVATIGLAPLPALAAWAVFRAADIAKRWFPGVMAAERLPGGWGVTADDVVAGMWGLAAGWGMQALTG